MSKRFPTTELPDSSKAGLIEALRLTETDLKRHAEALSPDRFFRRPSPEDWSAAEHTSHLITSVKAVANGLGISKWLIRLRFGKAKAGRSYPEMVAFYQSRLSEGVRASGPYVPQVETPTAEASEQRRLLLERWSRTVTRLIDNLGSWSERHLDTLRFPHPVLGKLTVREMLFFTHYHNLHHGKRVEEIDDS